MGNVVVLLFDDVVGAEQMLDNVNTWSDAGLVTVEDAVVVTRPQGNNTLQIKQTHKHGGRWALGGTGIGFLAGMLLGGPIGGAVVGAAIGGISGSMRDTGIDDKFIKQVSEGIGPNSSALFLMTSGGDQEKLLAELRPFRAKVISTTLDPDVEQKLRDALKDEE